MAPPRAQELYTLIKHVFVFAGPLRWTERREGRTRRTRQTSECSKSTNMLQHPSENIFWNLESSYWKLCFPGHDIKAVAGPRLLYPCSKSLWSTVSSTPLLFYLQGKPGKDGDPGSSGFPVSSATGLLFHQNISQWKVTPKKSGLLLRSSNFSVTRDQREKEAFLAHQAEMEKEYKKLYIFNTFEYIFDRFNTFHVILGTKR